MKTPYLYQFLRLPDQECHFPPLKIRNSFRLSCWNHVGLQEIFVQDLIFSSVKVLLCFNTYQLFMSFFLVFLGMRRTRNKICSCFHWPPLFLPILCLCCPSWRSPLAQLQPNLHKGSFRNEASPPDPLFLGWSSMLLRSAHLFLMDSCQLSQRALGLGMLSSQPISFLTPATVTFHPESFPLGPPP